MILADPRLYLGGETFAKKLVKKTHIGDFVGCQLKEEQQHETVNLEKMKKDLNIVRNGLQVRSFNGTVRPDFSGLFLMNRAWPTHLR